MRRASTVLTTALAVLLVGAMAAWACTNLATLNLSASTGQAGESVDVTGSSFRTADRGGQDVLIRWDALDGPVLATATPDATGSIVASVTIPEDASPGYHVLIATQDQVNDEGEASVAYGTPARATFLVGGALPEAAPVAAGAESPAVADTTSTGLIALTIILALAGLGLFGAGLGMFVREVRGREAVPSPVKED